MTLTYQEMSAPFEYKGTSDKAVLLLHGFLASPYIMHSLGKMFNAQGYTVKCICLPGHGTDFNDLRTVDFTAWQQAAESALCALKAEYAEVIIAGFSLGCILGLIAAFKYGVSRLILLSPAFQISRAAQLLNFLYTIRLSPLLPDLFCTQSEAVNWGSYRQFPAYAVIQVYKAIASYKKHLFEQKQLPSIYVAASTDDATVNFSGVINAMRIYPENSCYRIYTANPQQFNGKFEHDHTLVNVQQFDRIICFSHVALPVAPDDPYFGTNGIYYGKLPENIKFGEPTWRDKAKAVKRLTYNPDFAAMAEDILHWLSR